MEGRSESLACASWLVTRRAVSAKEPQGRTPPPRRPVTHRPRASSRRPVTHTHTACVAVGGKVRHALPQ
eukprot:1192902-Prymnesium_polylepis.1